MKHQHYLLRSFSLWYLASEFVQGADLRPQDVDSYFNFFRVLAKLRPNDYQTTVKWLWKTYATKNTPAVAALLGFVADEPTLTDDQVSTLRAILGNESKHPLIHQYVRRILVDHKHLTADGRLILNSKRQSERLKRLVENAAVVPLQDIVPSFLELTRWTRFSGSDKGTRQLATKAFASIILKRSDFQDHALSGIATYTLSEEDKDFLRDQMTRDFEAPIQDLSLIVMFMKPSDQRGAHEYAWHHCQSQSDMTAFVHLFFMKSWFDETIARLTSENGTPSKDFDNVSRYLLSAKLSPDLALRVVLSLLDVLQNLDDAQLAVTADRIASFARHHSLWPVIVKLIGQQDAALSDQQLRRLAILVHGIESNAGNNVTKALAAKALEELDVVAISLLKAKNFTNREEPTERKTPLPQLRTAVQAPKRDTPKPVEPRPLLDLKNAIRHNSPDQIAFLLKAQYFRDNGLSDDLLSTIFSLTSNEKVLGAAIGISSVQQSVKALTSSNPRVIAGALSALRLKLADSSEIKRASDLKHIVNFVRQRLTQTNGEHRASVRSQLAALLQDVALALGEHLDPDDVEFVLLTTAPTTRSLNTSDVIYLATWSLKVGSAHASRIHAHLKGMLNLPTNDIPSDTTIETIKSVYDAFLEGGRTQVFIGTLLMSVPTFQGEEVATVLWNFIDAATSEWLADRVMEALNDAQLVNQFSAIVSRDRAAFTYDDILNDNDFGENLAAAIRNLETIKNDIITDDAEREFDELLRERERIANAIYLWNAKQQNLLAIDVSGDSHFGYDIFIADFRKGLRTLVEVKTTVRPHWAHVFMTKHQLKTCDIVTKNRSGNYELALVEMFPRSGGTHNIRTFKRLDTQALRKNATPAENGESMKVPRTALEPFEAR